MNSSCPQKIRTLLSIFISTHLRQTSVDRYSRSQKTISQLSEDRVLPISVELVLESFAVVHLAGEQFIRRIQTTATKRGQISMNLKLSTHNKSHHGVGEIDGT